VGIPRKYRLTSGRLFGEVYKRGKMLKSPLFVVYYLPIEDGPKIGIVVSKKFGKAVRRNRLKRQIREIVRGHLPHLQDAVVILPRMKVKDVSFQEMKHVLDNMLEQVGRGDSSEVSEYSK
jgi:ribonuclease P protein component